jgi:alkylated DNA repair dioxygenase AlkB
MTQSILQVSLFETPAVSIPGLSYYPGYIDTGEESELLRHIEEQPWITELKRRVQHYGYRYYYKAGNTTGTPLGPMPDWLESYCVRLHKLGVFPDKPNQAIVNEYKPGQGIAPHIDRVRFDNTVASLSLGSPCVMDFIHSETGEKLSLLLEPRSLLVLTGNARYMWKHSIAPRKSDHYQGQIIQRTRRVSLTFRKLLST